MHHSAPNAKLYRNFAMKMGHPHYHILTSKAWWEQCFTCYDTSEVKHCQISATNKAKCCQIFAMEIWQRLQTHLESIDQDHIHFETKPQIPNPTHLKPRKLMSIACFQLPMSKNYDFTKTKDCLWTCVVGCLTHSSHVIGLPNSRIKIFLPIHIRLGKTTFFLA